ncbi:hypothetical protein J7J18_06505 [bacterium]|nr:hypothetical protein [bacterium]
MDLKEMLSVAKKKADSKYEECPECEEIAKDLMRRFPNLLEHAKEANIRYLKKWSEKSRYLGKCSRATGKWAYLTGYDYVIEVWADWWAGAELQEKEALLLHELRHIVKSITSQGKVKWGLRQHDVEEFFDVVRIYGAWDNSLMKLKKVLEESENESCAREEHTD